MIAIIFVFSAFWVSVSAVIITSFSPSPSPSRYDFMCGGMVLLFICIVLL